MNAGSIETMRAMLAQHNGTPLYIEDVSNHLHRLAQSMEGAARISDAMSRHPGFMAEHSARADTMRHCAMMVRALGENVAAGLAIVRHEAELAAELAADPTPDDVTLCAACGDTVPEPGNTLCAGCIEPAACGHCSGCHQSGVCIDRGYL
jgi:hypothetical protein